MVAPSRAQIKINAVSRLTKEHELYVKEEKDIEAKLQSLRQSAGDEYEIKKVQQVLDETKRVVPRVRESLVKEVKEAKALLSKLEGAEKTAASEAIDKAEKYLK